MESAHSLTGGDLQDLGGETDGPLDTKLLVLGSVDEIGRDCVGTISLALRIQCSRCNSHFSKFLTLLLVSVILILWIFAPGTGAPVASYSFSPLAT